MHIVLYGKPGCHLCEIAEGLILGMRREYRFTMEKIDITAQPALTREYGERIPVAVINDRIVLNAPIRTADLSAALAGQECG